MTLVAVVLVPLVVVVDAEDVFSGPKLVTSWALLVLAWWSVLMGALLRPGARRAWRVVPSIDLSVTALIVTSVVAMLLSIDRNQSLVGERLQHQGVLTLGLYLGWFALGRVLFTDRRALESLMVALVAGSSAVAAFAVAQRTGLDPVWQGFLPDGRVFSTIGQPNSLAAYLVIGLCCALTLAIGRRGVGRALASVVSALMILALVLTLSRGGYLAAGASMVVLAVGRAVVGPSPSSPPRRSRTSGATLGVATAFAVLVVVLTVLPWSRDAALQSWDRVESLSSPGGDESVEAHLDQWRVAVSIVADRPFVGTGPSTYPLVFPIYSRIALPPERVAYFDQFRVESAHNVVLDLAAGGGLPVALAWVAVMVTVVRVLVLAVRRSTDWAASLAFVGIVAVMSGYAVANSFMTAEVTGSWLLWLLMGAGVGVASARSDAALRTRNDFDRSADGSSRQRRVRAGHGE